MSYKLGSLFDGSGGFPLAGALCGVEPVWAAEVEPYPIAVTKSRFPNMKHLGDISKVSGADIEPVDIITFGSPCQDLSVAGKRAGLKHASNGDEETTRSGLFMETVRIIKEMRRATNGKYPRFALWENVPGAFSSNNGEDFRIVCEELIKIVEPAAFMPAVPTKGWNYADSFIGDGWSLAYRVFDAQYWGVPQRRRRIYLVVDFRGECAREVLFEREGLRGYFAEGGTPWQTTAADAQGCTGADDREGEAPTLTAAAGMSGSNQPVICLQGNGIDRADTAGCNGKGWKEDTCYTLNTIDRPAVAYGLDRARFNQGQNAKFDFTVSEEQQPTLTARGPGAVVYGTDVGRLNSCEDQSPTLLARSYKDPHLVAFAANQRDEVRDIGDKATALQAQPGMKQQTFVCQPPQYIVRRLTPTECARLQGFADWWGWIEGKKDFTGEEYCFWLEVRNAHARINGKKEQDYNGKQMLSWYNKLWTDSSEYKMWGNGIALPTALYCLQGITDALKTEEEDAWML